MPVLHSESESAESARVTPRQALIHELECLVRLAKEKGASFASLPGAGLTQLELMLLDSAFKSFPLEKADKTLLILPSKYEDMLQKAIVTLVKMQQ